MKLIHALFILFTCTGLIAASACGQAAALQSASTILPTVTAASGPTIPPGESARSLKVGDMERTYSLHIPPGMDSLRAIPLVFVFHGYTMDAASIQIISGFNEVADKNGFIVVYPSGVSRSWNGSGCCGEAVDKNIDDLAFVRQMLADLGTLVRIDPKRIYATGFSNGAIFSYRLGCEMSGTFAAIAPVSGWLLTHPCQPGQPVSVVQVHGSKDNYAGATNSTLINGVMTDVIYPGVEQGISAWAQIDGCGGDPQVDKQGIITHTAYDSCRNGTAVELYTLEGGAHAWPSSFAFPSASTQMIWDFFKAHPKP